VWKRFSGHADAGHRLGHLPLESLAGSDFHRWPCPLRSRLSVLVATLGPTWTHVVRCSKNGKEEEDGTKCDPVSDAVENAPSVSPPGKQADERAPTKYEATRPPHSVGERVPRQEDPPLHPPAQTPHHSLRPARRRLPQCSLLSLWHRTCTFGCDATSGQGSMR
jgi:hypothetical protein